MQIIVKGYKFNSKKKKESVSSGKSSV